MSISFLYGSLFAVAGFSIFMAQVLTKEAWTAYRALRACIEASFGHDTSVFPDHIP